MAPIWEGVTLIPDEITKAGTGQIVVTAVMLHAIKVLRSDGFFKHSPNMHDHDEHLLSGPAGAA